MEKEIERWYKKLWETKGSRFIAAKRFDRIDKYSNITIHIITAYLLCVNLLVLIPKRSALLSNENISFFTICASIILLVISLIISSRKYGDTSHKFHSCAREINILYDKVCYWKNTSEKPKSEDIFELNEKYNNILINYDINHSKLDYSVFKCENYKEYFKAYPLLYLIKIYSLNFIVYYLLYLLAIIIPILIFISLLSK
ncbi:SLATT domain-containing protein [Chryseobacterium lineare]